MVLLLHFASGLCSLLKRHLVWLLQVIWGYFFIAYIGANGWAVSAALQYRQKSWALTEGVSVTGQCNQGWTRSQMISALQFRPPLFKTQFFNHKSSVKYVQAEITFFNKWSSRTAPVDTLQFWCSEMYF